MPPLAFEFNLSVYPVDNAGTFIVDDRTVDYAELAEIEATLKAAERELGLTSAPESGPPVPGDGEEQEDEGGGAEPTGWGYPSNVLWLEMRVVTNQTGVFVVHTPETNGVYDLFATTNLSPNVTGLNLTNWQWLLRTLPGQTNLTVTNLAAPHGYFRLGRTNDSDGGGLSDAFERLVTHTDPNDPADDRLVPLVGLSVIDSVAIEQYPTNTARFRLSRLGGYVSWPLQVRCGLSGTATYAVDYSLAPATIIGTNVTVTFSPGQRAVELTLTAVPDSHTEGAETATLRLRGDAGYEIDPARGAATGWILEQYQYTYTTVADFRQGTMMGLEAVQGTGDGQVQFTSNLPPQFPFIAVACSGRGTVARINTTNGQVVGEYRTTPAGLTYSGDSGEGPQPSRTTVDLFGNVWVANRADSLAIKGTNYGSITRIGLIIGGSRFDKIGTNYVPNPQGQYVALSNATYNTCIDRDGDGFIRTSRGLANILPWDNEGGVDSEGGVSSAEDEAISEYVRVHCTGTRTIAVDKFNDIWVGGTGNRVHLKVNSLIAAPVPGSVFSPDAGGYGGVIDRLGNLWSTDSAGSQGRMVWLMPPTNYPPVEGTNWFVLYPGVGAYGVAVDPVHPYIWQTTGGEYVFRWRTNGVPVTNQYGATILHFHGNYGSQGLAVDTNGHVWVAHGGGSTTIGHLDTNATWLGNVQMRLTGLRGEYFANTNFSGTPALVTNQAPLNFNWGHGSPAPNLPSNYFSARWLGVLEPLLEGQHVLIVSADAGAAVRLTLEEQTVSSNWWDEPGPYPVELHLTNYLSTNRAYTLKVEYIEFTGEARVKLSWTEPGQTTPVVIPPDRFQQEGKGPTGVSVDAAGKIWAANRYSDNAMRIDPNAGQLVLTTNVVGGVTNIITNRVGLVDMVVDLGDGSFHPEPYNVPAGPYNYSDMTGFNNRVVNPTLQPLKGYWMVIHDSGRWNQVWQKLTWSNSLPAGCAMEVYVRASDDRLALANEPFVAVSNNVPFTGVNGRYIEVRLALVRDDPSKQPALYDLTLHGLSTSFLDWFLDDAWAYETEDAEFVAEVAAPEPLTYQWWVQWPWMQPWDWTPLTGETNASLVLSNVDSWVGGYLDAYNNFRRTWAMVLVTDAVGESLWLGPAKLWVVPSTIVIPTNGFTSGPATRYPTTNNVFGQPTNFNSVSVAVTLWGLNHDRSADINILLLSPCGTNVMLMSHAGGTNGVNGANLVFRQSGYMAPTSDAIPSGQTSYYRPSNYGNITNMPQVGMDPPPVGPYSTNLTDLAGCNPNGIWKLYIYDDATNKVGHLSGSWQSSGVWQLNFDFQ